MAENKRFDLIELLEGKPCLWDILSNKYTKREVKERAYAELAKHFDSSSAIVKVTINALRARTGWEMAKELKTKSGQTTDEKYVSKWMFYEQLKFLRAVTATTKSRDSISTQKKNDLDACFTSGKWTSSENKYSKNYHCQEKIKAVNKMCRIHGTRFVFQTTYSLCTTSREKTGQA